MKMFIEAFIRLKGICMFLVFAACFLNPCPLFAWTRSLGFEDGVVEKSGVDSAFDDTYHGSSDAPFALETDRVHTGRYSCRINYPAGSDGPDLKLDIPGISSGNLWVRAYLYLPSGWKWGPSWVKHIRTWYSNNSGTYLGFHSSGKPTLMTESPGARYDQNMGNDFNSVGDNTWHSYEYFVGNVGSSNQTHRVWVDGILILEQIGISPGAGSSITNIKIMDTWNDGTTQAQTCYYDDIVITTDTPTGRDSRGNPMIGPDGDVPLSNYPPSASAAVQPSSAEIGQVVTFSGTGADEDGTVQSYTWEFGDGASSEIRNPSHAYAQAGTYVASLTVTDDDGATGTDNVTVTVAAKQDEQEAWIISDDFESGTLDVWDDDLRQGQLLVQSALMHAGNNALVCRHDPTVNENSDYWGALFLGDHVGIDGDLQNEIWIEYWTYFSPEFQWPSFGQKMFILAAFESWSAGYASPNSWSPYYVTLYANRSGQMTGELNRKVGTDPGWRTLSQTIGTPVSFQGGMWYKVKCHMKLNSVGAGDGVFELFIDDNLKAQYTDVDYRSDYTNFGFNHLILSTYAVNSVPKAQEQYWDDIKLSNAEIQPDTEPLEVPGPPAMLTVAEN